MGAYSHSLAGDATSSRLQLISLRARRLGALEALRLQCAELYDADKPAHVRALKDLWSLAFPLSAFELPSQTWKDVGFQGTDPRTDLRGAGFLGLVHLSALLSQHGAGMLSLDEDLPSDLRQLPIAIASINCTAMLLSHLQLAPKLTCAFLPGGRLECTDAVLHAFLTLGWEGSGDGGSGGEGGGAGIMREKGGASNGATAADGEESAAVRRLLYVLQALHARLTLHLGKVWRRMCAEQASVTIMDFPTALRETFAHFQRALKLAGSGPWRLETLVGHLEDDAAGGQPLLDAARDGFGTLTDVAHDCVVVPTTWAFTAAYALGARAVDAVIGLCFGGVPPDSPAAYHAAHDKRQ